MDATMTMTEPISTVPALDLTPQDIINLDM
jgi:hypothetical protein